MDSLKKIESKDFKLMDNSITEMLNIIDEEYEIELEDIKNLIEKRIENSHFPSFESLDVKSQDRLIQIENYNLRTSNKIKALITKAKELRLNTKAITKDPKVGFSRKTVYNNELLFDYINVLICDEEDYFSEKKVAKLQGRINELEERYERIIENVLDTKIMELEIKSLKDEIKRLTDSLEIKHTIILENHKSLAQIKRIK